MLLKSGSRIGLSKESGLLSDAGGPGGGGHGKRRMWKKLGKRSRRHKSTLNVFKTYDNVINNEVFEASGGVLALDTCPAGSSS